MSLPRVQDSDVKTILDTAVDTTPFITTAHILVEETLYVLAVLSEDRLTQIELYLAAHFACLRDPRIAQEKVGDASNTYQGKTGLGLDASLYGQQVKFLDTTGSLASLGQQKVVLETI